MEESSKYGRKNNSKQKRKYLNMIAEGKLKDPPPSIIEKISSELGMDLQQEDACK